MEWLLNLYKVLHILNKVLLNFVPDFCVNVIGV